MKRPPVAEFLTKGDGDRGLIAPQRVAMLSSGRCSEKSSSRRAAREKRIGAPLVTDRGQLAMA